MYCIMNMVKESWFNVMCKCEVEYLIGIELEGYFIVILYCDSEYVN